MTTKTTIYGTSVLLATLAVAGFSSSAFAYGPEGLFGGRPQPDSTLVLSNPVELRNDRPERAESVLEHPRPDYDPAPIEFGSFELYPTLELGETYDSNIYANSSGERDDAVGAIRPVLELFSNWGRHAVSVTTFGDINYFSEHANEDYKNGVLDVNGRYDLANQTWLAGRAGYQRLAEQRTSPNAVNGSEPTTFGLAKAGVGYYRGVGQVKFNADYDLKRFDYDNTPSDAGTIDQSSRDRTEHVVGGKLGYDLSGNVKPYFRANYNARTYDNNKPHDSNGYDAVIGATADLGGITSIDLFAGWMEQFYDNFTAKKQVSTPKFGGRLDWNVTGLTSVVLEVNRTLEETTMTGYNSFTATGGSATLTHELRRNLLGEVSFSMTRDDFNGTGDRQDDVYTAGLGGRYLINRNLYTDLLYNLERRNSSEDTAEYTRHMGTARIGVRL